MLIQKLPEGVVASFTNEKIREEELFWEEKCISKQFDQRRKQDFINGRYCAHKCLSYISSSQPIEKSSEGDPIWPKGITGSISHTFDLAGAMLAKQEYVWSVGLDVEKIGRITPELWTTLFTEKEIFYIAKQSSEKKDQLSTLIYSLKEAFYKMQYPLTKMGMEFDEIEIEMNSTGFKIQTHPSFNKFIFNDKISVFTEIVKEHVISYILFKK